MHQLLILFRSFPGSEMRYNSNVNMILFYFICIIDKKYNEYCVYCNEILYNFIFFSPSP